MTNLVNSINVENEILRSRCEDLYKNLDQVAKVAIGSEYAQRLLPFVEISGSFRLSDDFPDGYTTIIGADDLSMYLQSGEYSEMVRRQCVVTICASLEAFVSSLFPIVGLEESDGERFGEFAKEFNLNMQNGNKVLRKIYYIYRHLKLALKFETSNWENVQCPQMLDEMFTIRHVIVHFGGGVKKPAHCERIGKMFRTERGDITLPPNSIDDFIHRVTINLHSLVKRMDSYVACSGRNE
ncbi:hypothetical protein [Stenotrophomonas geniculata]|uniref:hypothetical protein n=1 Tax=Stenotrophomonas geniculata TaxID=86188 RepID=UPI002E75BC39|nr:hypothetical protein [Stenotrophomonas geniculata]